jgi:hypothetical protein
MRLRQLLEQHKTAIVSQWFESLAKSYPPDTARFLTSQQDSFANPVGAAARQTLASLYDELAGSADPADLKKILDPLVRIRAVQTLFSPSQALAFVLTIKALVRNRFGNKLDEPTMTGFDAKVDRALLAAFDVFMGCREQIYRLKANEEQNKIYKAFARAGLVTENPEEPMGSGET